MAEDGRATEGCPNGLYAPAADNAPAAVSSAITATLRARTVLPAARVSAGNKALASRGGAWPPLNKEIAVYAT